MDQSSWYFFEVAPTSFQNQRDGPDSNLIWRDMHSTMVAVVWAEETGQVGGSDFHQPIDSARGEILGGSMVDLDS